MKWENLINLKKGYEIKYKEIKRNSLIYNGIIRDIDKKCSSFKNGRCNAFDPDYSNKRCIGIVRFDSFYGRCGIEDGWSLLDPEEFEDFIDKEEMKII